MICMIPKLNLVVGKMGFNEIALFYFGFAR